MIHTPQCSAPRSNSAWYLITFGVVAIVLTPFHTVGHPVRSQCEDCEWSSVHDVSSYGLYFNDSAAMLASFRRKANTTHRHIYQEIHPLATSFTEGLLPPADETDFVKSTKWNAVYGIRLPLLSFYCLLKPDDHKACQYVFTTLDRITSYSLWNETIPRSQLLLEGINVKAYSKSTSCLFTLSKQ